MNSIERLVIPVVKALIASRYILMW